MNIIDIDCYVQQAQRGYCPFCGMQIQLHTPDMAEGSSKLHKCQRLPAMGDNFFYKFFEEELILLVGEGWLVLPKADRLLDRGARLYVILSAAPRRDDDKRLRTKACVPLG